jgi:hypothetical protein
MLHCNKIILVLSLLLMPSLANAQRSIGIVWNVPSSQNKASKELHHFSDEGFTYLLINETLNPQNWRLIKRLGFKVYAALPVHFPTAENFSKADSSFYQKMRRRVADYESHPTVRAIGLFSFGQVASPKFRQEASGYINKMAQASSRKLFYQSSANQRSSLDSLFDFKVRSFSGAGIINDPKVQAFVYRPPASHKWDLAAVKQFMEATAHSPVNPVFFDSDWLSAMNYKYPHFTETLSHFAAISSAVFPLPKSEKQASLNNNINVIVISLLIAWILFGIAYRYDPLHQKSFSRFFGAHSFYVDDVMNHEIRTLFSGISILLQHALSGGIILYCIFETAFSKLGQQALFWHIPALSIFGTGKLDIFLLGILAVLVIEVISLLILLLTNKHTSHLSQAVNIYCWPLQLNLFTSTLAFVFFLSWKQPLAIYACGIVYLLIFFGSFASSSKDISHYLQGVHFWIFSCITTAYFAALLSFVGWLFSSTAIRHFVQLAVSLS